jgi:hypothetical protein
MAWYCLAMSTNHLGVLDGRPHDVVLDIICNAVRHRRQTNPPGSVDCISCINTRNQQRYVGQLSPANIPICHIQRSQYSLPTVNRSIKAGTALIVIGRRQTRGHVRR